MGRGFIGGDYHYLGAQLLATSVPYLMFYIVLAGLPFFTSCFVMFYIVFAGLPFFTSCFVIFYIVFAGLPFSTSCFVMFYNSFWDNIFLARDLEVLKLIYLFRLTFQTNTVRHQNITKLKCQDVKLDQLSRCQNEKVRVKTANKNITGQQYYINSVPGRAAGAPFVPGRAAGALDH